MTIFEEEVEILKLLENEKILIDNDRVKQAIMYQVFMNGENYFKRDIMLILEPFENHWIFP
jgi:hypothetical protein